MFFTKFKLPKFDLPRDDGFWDRADKGKIDWGTLIIRILLGLIITVFGVMLLAIGLSLLIGHPIQAMLGLLGIIIVGFISYLVGSMIIK